jgi:hypothetical protein
VPRVSDDDAGDDFGFHVPGVWERVLREIHRRDAESVIRFLPGEDPRAIWTIEDEELAELQVRARREADNWLKSTKAAREPVVVSRGVMRVVVSKDSPVLEDRSVHRFTVNPDDAVSQSF